MKRFLVFLCATVLVLGMFGVASATIIVDITGTPGSNLTTWTFSGSAFVGGGTVIIDDDNGGVSWGWLIGSAFYSGSNVNIDFTTTDAQFVADAVTYDILGVGAEVNRPNDVFGLAIENASNLESYSFFPGYELTSFTGYGIAPVDVTEFALGTTIANEYLNDLGDAVAGLLPVTFNVSSTPVPEPATMLLLGSGLIGLAGFRRKYKK